ncbi:hypothetical protein Tco_0075860, partial [Tanacetum coccineum]
YSHHSGSNVAEAEVDSLVRSSVPVMTAVTTVIATVDPALVVKKTYLTGSYFLVGGIRTVIDPDTDLQKTYVPQWSVTNGSRLDDELRSSKDASIEAMMNILCLEEPLAYKLGLNELQPYVNQLMVPVHHSSDKVIIGATALSLALDVSSIHVQKIRENIANQRSALRDVFVPLAEPFFVAALIGTEDDYEVTGTDDQAAADEDADIPSPRKLFSVAIS